MEDSGIDSDAKTASLKPSKNLALLYSNNAPSGVGVAESNSYSSSDDVFRMDGHGVQIAMRGENQKKSSISNHLIPIQRLSIPGKAESKKDHLPLVEWDSDESEEEVHFFPVSRNNVKVELTDTFSVEEMEISADEADLELLPPKQATQQMLCCPHFLKCTLL